MTGWQEWLRTEENGEQHRNNKKYCIHNSSLERWREGGAGRGWAGLGRHSRFDEDKLCSGRIIGVWVNHLSRQTVIS